MASTNPPATPRPASPAEDDEPHPCDGQACAGSAPVEVFVLDDHPVVAMGVRIQLLGDERFRMVGHAAEVERGIEQARLARAGALVLDLVYAGAVRLDAVRLARAALPDTAIIIFTSLSARAYAADAERSGADAFVTKDRDMAHLASIISEACTARRDAAATLPAPESAQPADILLVDGVHLSRREMQVAVRLGRGLHVADVAADLDLSPRTVAVHRENIRRKMNCGSSRELLVQLARLDAVSR